MTGRLGMRSDRASPEWSLWQYPYFTFTAWVSCHAFKLGMGSEQDARTTGLSPLLTLRFKCRTAYLLYS
ncbi:MAG: hypothetical protein RLP02_37575 [Coleofasciculus sp. C2-GNP5-27]